MIFVHFWLRLSSVHAKTRSALDADPAVFQLFHDFVEGRLRVVEGDHERLGPRIIVVSLNTVDRFQDQTDPGLFLSGFATVDADHSLLQGGHGARGNNHPDAQTEK